MKTFYGPTTLTFFYQGNQCQTSLPLPLLQSQEEIFFKGEGYNTSCYELPKEFKFSFSFESSSKS
jgi:hypothetical protein